jgi:hypothetical protein
LGARRGRQPTSARQRRSGGPINADRTGSLSQGPDSIVAMKKLILLAVLVVLGAVAAKKVRNS